MRLHNLFENTTPESLIEDIIDIELTDDFAIEGRIVEFNEDGSITVELDEQAQELVDLDEEVLNEFIPLAIGAAALGLTAYDAYRNYKAYKRGDITKQQLAKRVGVDAAIGITTGGIGKLASKAYKAGKAGVQAYKAKKAANVTPNNVAKVEPSALPATGAATGNAAGKTTAKKADDVKAKKKAARKKAGKRLRRAGMGAYGSVDYDDPLQRAVSNFSFESEDEFEPHMMYDPKTGEGKMAHTEADHLKMKDMGWTHDNPKTKEIEEAEYQGRKVKLGKPMAGDVKKFKVYVKNPKGNVVKVNFGQKGVKIKKNNPARRKSFRARHNCSNPGPRHKARYWSCRKW